MRELRSAMAREGLTVAKVQGFRAVIELPAVLDALSLAPPSRRAVAVFDLLVATARHLGDGLYAKALRNALAIDYSGHARNLTGRRREFMRECNERERAAGGRRFFDEDEPRTLFDMEQRMLEAMVVALGAPPYQQPIDTRAG